ncbi:MAG: hypothetical protein RBT04_10730, partial [Sphaerochaetaceae bacterium]|nr:hypothetical protein [Sphaerochaetaceae bacterium]
KRLEERFNEAISYFELFTDNKMPSNWALYNFDLSYLKDKERYTVWSSTVTPIKRGHFQERKSQ